MQPWLAEQRELLSAQAEPARLQTLHPETIFGVQKVGLLLQSCGQLHLFSPRPHVPSSHLIHLSEYIESTGIGEQLVGLSGKLVLTFVSPAQHLVVLS